MNTRQSEFLKLFPKAKKQNGILMICPRHIDDSNCVCGVDSCIKCREEYWLAPVEEE